MWVRKLAGVARVVLGATCWIAAAAEGGACHRADSVSATRAKAARGSGLATPGGACEEKGRPGERQVWIGMGTLEYCDGRRGLLFVWEPRGRDAEVLFVPSAGRWPREYPEWSHGRRDEILADIKRITVARGWNFYFEEFD
jgi:hypothetical protein